MRKINILLVAALFLMIACKKSNSSATSNPDLLKAPYYFTCHIGGDSLSFTNKVSCLIPTGGDTVINGKIINSSTFQLQGDVNAASGAHVQILITGPANFVITPGSYAYPSSGVSCDYIPNNSDPLSGFSYWGGFQADTMSISFLNNLQVVITSLEKNNTAIKGTFAGNVAGFDQAKMSSKIATFTSGSFYLPCKIQ